MGLRPIRDHLPEVLRRIRTGTLPRPCEECGDTFDPETRFERVCPDCRERAA